MATFDANVLDETSVWIVLLGIGPLAVGHTLINAALRRLPATIPNTIATQEIPAGVFIGAIWFQEIPGPTTLISGFVALAGVIAVVIGTPALTRNGLPPKA